MEHEKINLDQSTANNDQHVLTNTGDESGHGRQPGRQLTVASEQNADVVPDLQVRACLAVLAASYYWILQLFTITSLAAYSRNITAASALGGSDKQSWILNAYNVVTIVAAPTLSYFADQYGRRWLLIVPALAGCIGGAIACRASSVEMVIVGTAFIGFAGSRLGISTAVPSEVMPHRYRSIAQSVVFTMSSFGAFPALLAISKSIGADAVDGWRVAFYIIIAGYAVDGLLWLVVYRPPPRQTEITENRPSLDYVGYALLGMASVLFLMGLTWGGVTYPWSSSHVLGTLIPGIVLYIAFGVWEWKGRSDGICHHALFQSRNFPLSVLAIAIEGFVYLSFTALFPGQLATVYEHDIFKAGGLACIFYAAFVVTLPIGGIYAAKTRDIISPIIVGYIVFSAGIIGFLCSKPDNKAVFLAMDALAGIGFSQPLVFLTVVAQFAAPPSLIALSTAIVLSVRALGGAVGIAVTQTVLESNLNSKLPAYIASATIPLGLNPQLLGPVIGAATGDTSLIGAILSGRIPGVTPQILGAASDAAAQAFSDSYRLAWAVVLPFSVVGGLSLVLFKRNKQQLDYIIDAPLEHVHHSSAGKV